MARVRSGLARAAKLAPERRSEIAREAAEKRWAEKRETAAHDSLPKVLEGYSNTLNLAGTKLPCAVISGVHGVQRVLSENGITNAILGSRSGASKRLKKAADDDGSLLPLFIAPSQLERFISNELRSGPLIRLIISKESGSLGDTMRRSSSLSAMSGSRRGRRGCTSKAATGEGAES